MYSLLEFEGISVRVRPENRDETIGEQQREQRTTNATNYEIIPITLKA